MVSTGEDTKSAMGPYCKWYKSIVWFFFFPCLPLAQTQNLGPVCYASFGCFIDPKRHILHTQSVYNKNTKFVSGQHQVVSGDDQTPLGCVIGAVREKKKQTVVWYFLQ